MEAVDVIEKIGPIRNPLTIIAIFAGIAEISGTAILPFLNLQNQSTYIWFLMLFPSILVALFFATLNFNHRALYAPSDYRDEDNFFRGVKEGTVRDRIAKVKSEMAETEAEGIATDTMPSEPSLSRNAAVNNSKRNSLADYLFAEDLALNELSLRLGSVRRSVELYGIPYLFDGVIKSAKGLVLIEVKYLQNLRNIKTIVRNSVDRLASALNKAPNPASLPPFSVLVSIVTDDEKAVTTELDFDSLVQNAPFPVKVEVSTTSQLMGLIRDFP